MPSPCTVALPSHRSRRNLTYREKLAIIQRKEEDPSCTQRHLAVWAMETFGLESKPTQATISNLLRGKDKLMSAVVPPEFRSARRVKHPELDRIILCWVHAELQCGRCMTRSAVQSKAMALAQEMQLPSNVSFSKGWISSFMKRHELNFTRKKGKQVSEAETKVEHVQAQQVEGESEAEEEEVSKGMGTTGIEMENVMVKDDVGSRDVELMTASIVVDDPVIIPSVKRSRLDDGECKGSGRICQSELQKERLATHELLLDWIAVPGSYSRWWLLKNDEEKEPLCNEINVFLRSHGMRNMTTVDIRQQLTAFVTTFLAAHTWLRQTQVNCPLGGTDTSSKRIRSHVLQMCPNYERLVTVLAPYVNYDDSPVSATQKNEAPATATVETVAPLQIDSLPVIQARESSITNPKLTRPAESCNMRRQSSESISEDSFDDETKAQKRHLFELECTRLQSEIETKNIKLVLEKTLARKKLLDAGISSDEVDRIFP